jgi:hypothetical protein
VQNVKDLQVLERLVGAAWMRPLIEAGVAWLVERDPAQLVVRHRGATSLLAVLGMELAHADGAPDPRLRAGLELAARRLAAAGIGLPVDLVTCTMGSAAHAALGALDPRLVPVGLPDGGLLVLNPAMVAVEGVPPGGSQLRPGGLARPGVRP